MDTIVGLKLGISSIRYGFNSYEQNIATPNIKGDANKMRLMDTSVGLKIATSSIRDGLNSYTQHISTPNIKGADNASVQMALYNRAFHRPVL
jgi:hypothetical protein